MDTDTTAVIEQALETAPPYIREYLRSGKYAAFIEDVRLIGNYHVDTLGIISDEVLMMLLGMSDPRELAESLKREAKLTDEQIGLIISLANDHIFTPLRSEARKEEVPNETVGKVSAAPLVGPPSLSGVSPAALSTPASIPGYPPDPTRPAQGAPVAAAPLSVPPPVPLMATPEPMPLPVRPAPPTMAEPIATPTMRTMAHDVEAMKDGQPPAPLPYTGGAPAVAAPRPEPVAAPPVVSSLPPPSAPPSLPMPAAPSEDEVHATLKQYGIDPYREPVE